MSLLVYKITNTINGKLYIGKTSKSVEWRWKRHCNSGQCPRLRAAIDKYGKEAFTVETLEICNSPEELNERERYWIAYYDSTVTGYNVLQGGNEIPALHHTHLTAEQEKEIIKLKESGLTSVQIGKKFHIVPQTVANVFKKHHKKLHFTSEKLSDRIPKEKFIEFVYKHPTRVEVEKKFKISKAGVYNYMRQLNLPISLLTSTRTVKHIEYMEKYSKNVMELHNSGESIRFISQIVGIARETVAKIIEYNTSTMCPTS